MPRRPSITDERSERQANELVNLGLAYVETRTNKKGEPELVFLSRSGLPASESIIRRKSHLQPTEKDS
jgi:hypothetical protein